MKKILFTYLDLKNLILKSSGFDFFLVLSTYLISLYINPLKFTLNS